MHLNLDCIHTYIRSKNEKFVLQNSSRISDVFVQFSLAVKYDSLFMAAYLYISGFFLLKKKTHFRILVQSFQSFRILNRAATSKSNFEEYIGASGQLF